MEFGMELILPNHHYPLHIPKQLEWWGPLMIVLEFPSERLIGLLQKCKTNANPSEHSIIY
ncbi:hypothetical protein VP01_2872g5 [Puccinia sorghi]|uniref:Uncharacterized protein n=1 Tax=Puccinia sorghi TaxID=27349 RepID=A0A0L6V3M0_9BASI|nr:hypothetical protein VP01_2872g5 [Puccinia sorghi]